MFLLAGVGRIAANMFDEQSVRCSSAVRACELNCCVSRVAKKLYPRVYAALGNGTCLLWVYGSTMKTESNEDHLS
jgi:hypothetical protein